MTEARTRAAGAGQGGSIPTDPAGFARYQAAQAGLTAALSHLMVVVERYPELHAAENFRDLQSQLEGTENRISVERMRSTPQWLSSGPRSTEMEPESSSTRPSPSVAHMLLLLRRERRAAAILAGAVILLVIAYGVGRVQGYREVSRVEAAARATQLRAGGLALQLRARVAALEGDVARRTRAAAVLEGRRQLGLALLSLDDRNFGLAQGHVDAARVALRCVGPDEPGLFEVARQLAGLSVVAAGDFADQRARVLAIVRAFDQHLPGTAG